MQIVIKQVIKPNEKTDYPPNKLLARINYEEGSNKSFLQGVHVSFVL